MNQRNKKKPENNSIDFIFTVMILEFLSAIGQTGNLGGQQGLKPEPLND
jgi:hypothetical protein